MSQAIRRYLLSSRPESSQQRGIRERLRRSCYKNALFHARPENNLIAERRRARWLEKFKFKFKFKLLSSIRGHRAIRGPCNASCVGRQIWASCSRCCGATCLHAAADWYTSFERGKAHRACFDSDGQRARCDGVSTRTAERGQEHAARPPAWRDAAQRALALGAACAQLTAAHGDPSL